VNGWQVRVAGKENEGKVYEAFLIEDLVKWGETAICGLFKGELLFQSWCVLTVKSPN